MRKLLREPMDFSALDEQRKRYPRPENVYFLQTTQLNEELKAEISVHHI